MYTPLTRRKRSRERIEKHTALGVAVGATLHALTEEDLLKLIVTYSNRRATDDLSDLAELLLRALGEIHIQSEPTDEQIETVQRASEELRKSHLRFRAAVTWLCSPKIPKATTTPTLKQLEAGKLEWGRFPLIDKESEEFIRYFENHGLKHFKSRVSLQESRLLLVPQTIHLVDVLCACILNNCVYKSPSEMPIKICPRCTKCFLSQRGKYCSEVCQWKSYWTPDRRADDKWVKDLEKFSQSCRPKYGRSIADLQKKLALPKVEQRLRSIKDKIKRENWVGWGRIAKRIAAIETLAAESHVKH